MSSIIETYFKTKDRIRQGNRLLGIALLLGFCFALANTLDYFFGTVGALRTSSGIVDIVDHRNFTGYRRILYSKTMILLKNNKTKFQLSARAGDGGYVGVAKGDQITIYTRKWYQVLYQFAGQGNIVIVEKDGSWVYNNTGYWKAGTFAHMVFFGILSFFLFMIYLDQVRNISISKWVKKRL